MRPRTKNTEVSALSLAVKALRDALGQTQQQFAQTLNTAITTIARYETGREPKGMFLSRLAEVASQHNQSKLADIFRQALVKELGSWDTAGFSLSVEPKNDVERLYVNAVLAMLRNDQYTAAIPKLNKVLAEAAKASIEKFEWIKANRQAQHTVRKLLSEGITPEQVAETVGVPVAEVRHFMTLVKLEELGERLKAKRK